jgi:hypothetical protein
MAFTAMDSLRAVNSKICLQAQWHRALDKVVEMYLSGLGGTQRILQPLLINTPAMMTGALSRPKSFPVSLQSGRTAFSTLFANRSRSLGDGATDAGTVGLRLFMSRAAARAAAARAAFGSKPSMNPGRNGASAVPLGELPGAPSLARGLGKVTLAPRGAPAPGDGLAVEGAPDEAAPLDALGAAVDAGAAVAAGEAAGGDGAAVVSCGGAGVGVGAAAAGAGVGAAAAGAGVGGVGAGFAGSAAAAFGGSGVAALGSGVAAFGGSETACLGSAGDAGVGSTTSRFGGVISIGGKGLSSVGAIGCGTASGATRSTRVGVALVVVAGSNVRVTGSGGVGTGSGFGGSGIVTGVGNSCFGTIVTLARSVGGGGGVGAGVEAVRGVTCGVGVTIGVCGASTRGCNRARIASPDLSGRSKRILNLSPPS